MSLTNLKGFEDRSQDILSLEVTEGHDPPSFSKPALCIICQVSD